MSVSKYFNLALIMVLQQRYKQRSRGGMFAEIRGDITNSQPTVWIAIIGMRLNERSERFRVLAVPVGGFVGDRPRVVAGMKLNREDQIAVKVHRVGLESDRLAKRVDRLTNFTTVLQGITEI